MRELRSFELDNVQGGLVPLLFAGALALGLGGCATTASLRKGERPPAQQKLHRP